MSWWERKILCLPHPLPPPLRHYVHLSILFPKEVLFSVQLRVQNKGKVSATCSPESCLTLPLALGLLAWAVSARPDQPSEEEGGNSRTDSWSRCYNMRIAGQATLHKITKDWCKLVWFWPCHTRKDNDSSSTGHGRGHVVGAGRIGVSLCIFINDLKDRGKQHANETCRWLVLQTPERTEK